MITEPDGITNRPRPGPVPLPRRAGTDVGIPGCDTTPGGAHRAVSRPHPGPVGPGCANPHRGRTRGPSGPVAGRVAAAGPNYQTAKILGTLHTAEGAVTGSFSNRRRNRFPKREATENDQQTIPGGAVMIVAQEEVYNTHLALMLAAEGMDITPERRQGRKRIDALATIRGVRVAVEAKIGNRRGAMTAAQNRIDEGLADAAVAVSYPPMADPSKLVRLDAAVAGGRWRTVDIPGLGRLIKVEAGQAGDVADTLAMFRAGLEQAAGRIDDDDAAGAVRAANIPLPSKEDVRKNRRAADHPRLRLALLIASAALFHANVDGLGLRRPRRDARTGNPYEGPWPPGRIRECLRRDDVIDSLIDAWETILAFDYKPVFQVAVDVLRELPAGAAAHGFARTAATAGVRAASSLAGQRHDLLGRVFHWILATATPTGAFYTSEAAATLLAALAVRPADAERFPDLTVVDPACGTGTLLIAVAKQLAAMNRDAAGPSGGQHLIERVLRGYDIEPAAIQLAAVALGLMNPRVKFETMGIHHLKYGSDGNGGGLAGSLELYGQSATANLLTPHSAQIDNGTEQLVRAERHDIVIMNPPFTRVSLRHDHLGPAGERAVKNREREILRGAPATLSHGGMFLLLGDRLCDENDGTLAFVVPTAGCGSASTQPIWRRLLETFHLETVVTSHDPRRHWFSENTGILESLFVFRRRNNSNRDDPVRFYNLPDNPPTPADALRAAADVAAGTIPPIEWPTDQLRAGDWTPVKYLTPYLTEMSARWFTHGGLGCVPLADVADVGPEGRRTRDVYTRAPVGRPDRHGRFGLWFNNQEGPAENGTLPKQSLRAEPDCALIRKQNTPGGRDQAGLADSYWEQRGRLMIGYQFRLSSSRTCAVRVDEPALGSVWIPAKHTGGLNPAAWEKAMCAYLNSTVGVMAQVKMSASKFFGRVVTSLDKGMRNIPVPPFDAGQAGRMARVFDGLADRPLMRLRDVADDGVRQMLDRAVCEVLGWDLGEVEAARGVLAREPSVTGRPAG